MRVTSNDILTGLKKLEVEGLSPMSFEETKEWYSLEPYMYESATDRQIRFVYVVGKAAGYTSTEIHSFGHHHMTRFQIKKLIDQLKKEAGWEDDEQYRQY